MQSYKKEISNGMSSDVVILIITITVSLLIVPLYLNFITLEEYGIYLTIQGLISVISLLDIGLPLYSVKKLSNDRLFYSDNLTLYLSSVQIFQYLVGVGLLIVGVVIYNYLEYIIVINPLYVPIIKELFMYSGLTFIFGIFVGINHSILKSRHQLVYVNTAIFMIALLTGLFSLLFLYLNNGLESFGYGILIATILVNAAVSYKVYKEYRLFVFAPKEFNKNYIVDGINYIKKYQITRLAETSKTSLFTVLLSNFSGQVGVAQYNITNKIPELIPNFISKIISNLFPSISSLYEQNKIDEIGVYYKKILNFGILSTMFAVFGLLVLNEIFIDLWVGSDKFTGYGIFLLILFKFIILMLNNFTNIIIQSSGVFNKLPILSALEVLSSLFLAYIFFKLYGIIGFFIGYTLPLMITLIYSFKLVDEILKINILEWIIKDVINSIFVIVLLSIFTFTIWNIVDFVWYKFMVLSFSYILVFIYVTIRRFKNG